MRFIVLILAIALIAFDATAQQPVLNQPVDSIKHWVKLTDLSTCAERSFKGKVTRFWSISNQLFEGLPGVFNVHRDSNDRISEWSFEPSDLIPTTSLKPLVDRIAKRLQVAPKMENEHTYSWKLHDRVSFLMFKETSGLVKIIYGEERESSL